ncbi:MAG: hypothetical protein JXN59_00005, partial [Anaerolineae bacterium]|nr:hypothetical protein [Anaerolineae bacterium]
MSKDEFLQPIDDGLPMRSSQEYAALYKLKALSLYLEITNTAMHKKPWIDRYFIDLQAGPGKNKIGNDFV